MTHSIQNVGPELTRIRIHSAMATGPNTTWEGSFHLVVDKDIEAHLERIFRYFNRVDSDDTCRLEYLGYRLPSLSVGDTVTFLDGPYVGQTWRVAAMGFERVEGEQAA
jgi:hypothetical protein